MIESLYWKEELLRITNSIRPVPKPKRWSERAACTVVRDVSIGFFIVRKMIEIKKTSPQVSNMDLNLFCAPTINIINKLNYYNIKENYDWEAETMHKKSLPYVCNQFIHSYLINLERSSDRNWSDLLVVSDFDRNDVVWRVPVSTIIQIFETLSNDSPSSITMSWNPNIGDYKVRTE
jgi:hypothetical protein